MKNFIIAANWKMNKNPDEAKKFLLEFAPLIKRKHNRRIILFPQHLAIGTVTPLVKDLNIEVGAQNCFYESSGAYTGETSPLTLSQMGVTHVLVGHSERRQIFAELDAMLARKVKAAVENKLSPMLCVGETLAERESGRTNEVITRQLKEGLRELNETHTTFTVAYEPVWAIGTGKVASPQQVQDAHKVLRDALKSLHTTWENQCILYGGSVKPSNAKELAALPNVDGFLIGGASLIPADLAQIDQNS